MPNHQIGDRLSALLAPILLADVSAHRAQHPQQASAARIEADTAQDQFRTRHQRRRNDEERRRRKIAWHIDLGRAQTMPTEKTRAAGRKFDRPTERMLATFGWPIEF